MKSQSKNRIILLEDGTIFRGTAFGAMDEKKVELVFNTSMAGYQEIISDLSYTDQAVVMTYPLIGNYGICEDDYESDRPSIAALIVKEYSNTASNFRAVNGLGEIMERFHIAGVEGIDTRKLTRHIRDYGSCKAWILTEDADLDKAAKDLAGEPMRNDQVSRVSTGKIYEYGEKCESDQFHVAVIDCGIKKNILRMMKQKGCRITVVPWNTPAEDILALNPDGVFLSNGPGDPTDVTATVESVKQLIGKLPIFGICLGHQIVSLAYGGETYKLKFGHRGGNHPVINLMTDKIEITSQNHSYAVKEESLASTPLKVTHRNLLDGTIEGVSCEKDLVFSVQYHPESAPGPQDSAYLFDLFLDNMKKAMSKEEV